MTNDMNDLDRFLPLSPPVYNILLALGDRALHGYAIIQEFEQMTGEAGSLLPGSLYNTVARMLKSELVEESTSASQDSEDPRRRYYVVTALGRAVARAESARLRKFLLLAEAQDYLPDEV